MKKRVVLWLFGLCFSLTFALAQEVPVGVVAAFKKGSAQELAKFLGDKVELIVQGKSAGYDKQKAREAMAGFFSGNKVSGFEVNHQGKRNESSFMVGTLATAHGNYRVNCFFRRVENNYVIHQIRIDKNDE